jgi:hypothetical protein
MQLLFVLSAIVAIATYPLEYLVNHGSFIALTAQT